MLRRIPGVPRLSASLNIRKISSSVGSRRYVSPILSTTAAQKRFTVTRAVVSDMSKYSSMAWNTIHQNSERRRYFDSHGDPFFTAQLVFCWK